VKPRGDSKKSIRPTYSLAAPETCPDFEFVIKRVSIPDSVLTAFQANRTSEIGIQTKENEVRQAELEADAIEKRGELWSRANRRA
jgi:hypothetical protein